MRAESVVHWKNCSGVRISGILNGAERFSLRADRAASRAAEVLSTGTPSMMGILYYPHGSPAYYLRANMGDPNREAEADAAEGKLPPLPELPYVPTFLTQVNT